MPCSPLATSPWPSSTRTIHPVAPHMTKSRRVRRWATAASLAALPLAIGCTRASLPADTRRAEAGGPIDMKATAETRALFFNLRRLAREHVLFGHQDDLAYGYDWVAEPGRSDVRESSGSYPAVYGWEVSGLETSSPKNMTASTSSACAAGSPKAIGG